ncbi:MAG: hypothetical protein AAF213_11565 [Pseudomonadota bacterium]
MSQGGGGGGGGNQQDPTFGIALGAMFIGVIIYLIYKSNAEGIHYTILQLRNIEMWITTQVFAIGGLVSSSLAEQAQQLANERQQMMAIPPDQYKWSDITQLSVYVGNYIRWGAAPILLVIAWYMVFKYPKSVLRRSHSLTTLISYQAKRWPSITPIVKNDPLHDKEGQWLEALEPEEWAERHGIEIEDNAPDRESARAAFTRQLRRPWTEVTELPPYLQAIVAALVLRGNKKNSESEEVLTRLARGAASYGSAEKTLKKDAKLTKMVMKTLNDNKLMAEPTKVARQHAWVETSMAAMLDWARVNGGVLASADFLWLKLEDRAMWYVLNAVGRPTILVEASGAVAHWRAEIVTRRPMPEPDVDEAVFGLEEYLAGH